MEEDLHSMMEYGFYFPLMSLPIHKSVKFKRKHEHLTKPDRGIAVNFVEKCCLEVKSSKTFPGEDWNTIESYAQDLKHGRRSKKGALPLGQIFNYVLERKQMYGVLTSYQYTLFLKIMFNRRDQRVLYISEPFHHSSSDPGVLQAFSYFLCIIQKETENEAVKRRRSSTISSAGRDTEDGGSRRGREGGGKKRRGASGSTSKSTRRTVGGRRRGVGPDDANSAEEQTQDPSEVIEGAPLYKAAEAVFSEEDSSGSEIDYIPLSVLEEEARHRKEDSYKPELLAEDDFEYMEFLDDRVLGVGAGGTSFLIRVGGLDLAVKGCDLCNSREAVSLMENEILMYRKLEELQGDCIPRYRGSMERGILKLMARDYVDGNTYDKDEDENRSLLNLASSQLQKIHQLGVVHGDIRSSNIIVKRNPDKVMFIDFGLSELTDSEEYFRFEMEALEALESLVE